MIEKTMYRISQGGRVTWATAEPEPGVEYELRYRLIADEGKALTDGEFVTLCVDLVEGDASDWWEIEAPAEDEPME